MCICFLHCFCLHHLFVSPNFCLTKKSTIKNDLTHWPFPTSWWAYRWEAKALHDVAELQVGGFQVIGGFERIICEGYTQKVVKSKGILQKQWQNEGIHALSRLGGGFNDFLFSSLYLGKIPILTNFFQRGWNHQLVIIIWSNYSDLTRVLGPQNVAFWKGNPRKFQGHLGSWKSTRVFVTRKECSRTHTWHHDVKLDTGLWRFLSKYTRMPLRACLGGWLGGCVI